MNFMLYTEIDSGLMFKTKKNVFIERKQLLKKIFLFLVTRAWSFMYKYIVCL